MPLVKRLRKRGAADIVVVANAEVLWVPAGPISRFNRRLSNAITRATANAAPSNKRPRWNHYGEPLKKSFTSSTDIDTAAMRIHTAVGSRASYAAYVDQGTRSFQAKILPPWTRQSPSLYEHTYKIPDPGGETWSPVGKITVRGQRARYFMDSGLRLGMAAVRLPNILVPGQGGPMMSRAVATFPDRLANFRGNTPSDEAFQQSLDEWRSWRDEAWSNGRILGQGYVRERYRRELRDVRKTISKAIAREERLARTSEQRKASARARSQRYRDKQRALKPGPKPAYLRPDEVKESDIRGFAQVQAKNKAALKQFLKQNPRLRVQRGGFTPNGATFVTGSGQKVFLTWDTLYQVL